jgi:ATP-dependent protease ClpP protease subunit
MKQIIMVLLLILMCAIPASAEDIFKTEQDGDKSTYTVFFDGDIVVPVAYRDIIMLLNTAKDTDTIIFVINSHGGVADSCFAICNAIKHTKAYTIADLYTGYSAGAFIALSCNKIQVNDNSSLMLHCMQGGAGDGSIAQIAIRTDFFNRLNTEVILYFCKNFLTHSEIARILSGEEIWLTGSEIKNKIGGK